MDVVSNIDKSSIHGLKYLSDEEGWQLFKKKVFPRSTGTDLKIDRDKENLGKQIVKHCRGLPLAIIVLSGLLKGKQTSEWEKVGGHVGSYLKGGKDMKEERILMQVLAYSYQDLPYRLKPCFLYLGLYPEDHQIELEQLYQLWMAEGFTSLEREIIEEETSKDLEKEIIEEETSKEVAQHYMEELMQRCMVQPQLNEYTGRVEYCRIHDLMRQMCWLKINEENFLKIVNFPPEKNTLLPCSSVKASLLLSSSSTTSSSNKIHRLAIYKDDMEDKYSSLLDKLRKRSERARSLLLFLNGSSFDWSSKLMCSFMRKLKLLTTLHLEGESIILSERQFGKLIQKLIYLRCLSCRDCCILNIPSSISKLRFLQTLDLRSHEVHISNVLWKMENLRHLYLPRAFTTKGKLQLEGLVNLETLAGFDSDTCDIHDLCKLPNLRQLKAAHVIKDNGEIINLCNNITSPNKKCPLSLQDSSIWFDGCNFSSEEELELLKQLLMGRLFNDVSITGPLKEVLTLSHDEISSSSVTVLKLVRSELEKDPMPVLEKLCNLKSLMLIDTFLGKEMVCLAGVFPHLKYLVLWSLRELEEWKLEEGALPSLSKLRIVHCKKLKMIPDGLRFVSTLQELEIQWMPLEFANRLQVIDGREGEDFHKVQHIPSITFREIIGED
ncbi:hypothetical protein NMG60_11032181 [Bertholletia excelsa]